MRIVNDFELNKIYHMDCLEGMRLLKSDSVDLTVTSPPYDNLRNYNGYSFDFEAVAKELYRVTKIGGVVIWVVGDSTVKGSETGTSFKQALYFKEVGFSLHDTMIYQKSGITKNHNRYEQDFEYMFVFSRGKPKTFNPIRVPTKYPEKGTARSNQVYSETDEVMRAARSGKQRTPVGADKIKGNIWYYPVGKNHSTKDEIAFKHPATFPEKLAEDHILSWSGAGDLVLDPFMGSGTTAKMAIKNSRNFIGFEISKEYCEIAKSRLKESGQ
jgi:site-specific DNA-methyltransferase (adenine-specific)